VRPLVRTTAAAIAITLMVCAPPAYAQRPRPDRPYRGLFGGNGASPNSAQQLDVNVSLFASYDDNLLASTSQGYVGDPRFQQSGGYGAGNISLDYTKRVRKATFELSGGTGYRYYRSMDELNGFNSFLSIGLSATLSPKTEVRISESLSYTPYYSFSPAAGIRPPAPGDIIPNNPDNPLAEEPALGAYSSLSMRRDLTRRSSLNGEYTFSYFDYRNRELPFRSWAAGGGYTYRLNTRANMRAAYHYRRGVSGLYYANQSIDTQDVEVGFDYTKRLSPSRTMALGFMLGPSIYRSYVPVETAGGTEDREQTLHPVRGSAYLTTQIARSWSLGVNYSRGVQYTQGFSDPFFSDYVTVGLTGFVSERSRMTFGAGYNAGTVGYATVGRGYDTVTATASYQYALARWAALFVNYGYYHYLFEQSVQLPQALARGQDRSSVSVGMNLWAPLLR
jgi:hypothetical protein